MSLILQIVLALLVVLVALVAFLLLKAMKAFRNLSEERLRVYTAYSGELHETMHALRTGFRRGDPFPYPNARLDGEARLIGSLSVLQLNAEVTGAFANLFEKIDANGPYSEINAAINAAEEKLVELNVAMRDDLTLNHGTGRFPNAEVFRRKRGTK